MRKYLALLWLFVVAAAPAGAQQAGSMNAMGYYTGTWACVGGPLAQPPVHATVVFAMNGSVLNSNVSVPQQTGMKSPYYQVCNFLRRKWAITSKHRWIARDSGEYRRRRPGPAIRRNGPTLQPATASLDTVMWSALTTTTTRTPGILHRRAPRLTSR